MLVSTEVNNMITDEEYSEYCYQSSVLPVTGQKEFTDILKESGIKSSRDMTKEQYGIFMRKYSHDDYSIHPEEIIFPEVNIPSIDVGAITFPQTERASMVRLKGYDSDVEPNSIPIELRNLKRWTCWGYTATRRTDGSVKLGKPPFLPNGRFAANNTLSNLSTFDIALGAYNGTTGASKVFAGIGYNFIESDFIWGIDVDHCLKVVNGEIVPSGLASRIISAFCGTYIEVSPSGLGLRVFGKGRLPANSIEHAKILPGNPYYEKEFPHQGIEWYSGKSAKTLTVTGHALYISTTGLNSLPMPLRWLRYAFFLPSPAANPSEAGPYVRKEQPVNSNPASESKRDNDTLLTNEDVLRIAFNAKNGDKVRMFYNNTDGGDRSRGDFTLLALLAFYALDPKVGGGIQQLDSLFRSSSRMRPKWDERHYKGGVTYGNHLLGVISSKVTRTFKDNQR